MVISSESLQVRTQILPQLNWMNPEEKATSVVNKIIVPTSIIVYIQDNLRELIHDNTICIDRLLDEYRGIKKEFFAVELVTDIGFCEYTLEKGRQLCNPHGYATY